MQGGFGVVVFSHVSFVIHLHLYSKDLQPCAAGAAAEIRVIKPSRHLAPKQPGMYILATLLFVSRSVHLGMSRSNDRNLLLQASLQATSLQRQLTWTGQPKMVSTVYH